MGRPLNCNCNNNQTFKVIKHPLYKYLECTNCGYEIPVKLKFMDKRSRWFHIWWWNKKKDGIT